MSEMIEKVARSLADADGWNPDLMVFIGEPIRIGKRAYVTCGEAVPVWHLYAGDAQIAVETMQPAMRAAYELGMADANKARDLIDEALK